MVATEPLDRGLLTHGDDVAKQEPQSYRLPSFGVPLCCGSYEHGFTLLSFSSLAPHN